VQREASFRVLEGAVIATAGFITLAITSCITAFALFLSLLRLGILKPAALLGWGIFISLVSLVAALSFFGAYKNAWGADYSGAKGSLWGPISGGLLKGMAASACDLLFSGPRLLFTSCDSFGKALRLLRLDIPRVTAILLWLWERGWKATVEEVSLNFPGLNAVRILPQLRDIPGVIWLPKIHGVIILSEEFRRALASAISRDAEPASPESDFAPEDNAPVIDHEIVGWYETLGLPPFAPIREVKRRYRQLVKIYHPDAQKRDGYKAEDQIKRINAAYHNIIKNSASASKE